MIVRLFVLIFNIDITMSYQKLPVVADIAYESRHVLQTVNNFNI